MDRSRTSACTAIRSDMIWKSTTLSSSRYFDKTNPTPLTCSDRIKNSANYIRSFVCFSRSLDFIGKLTKPLVFPSSETNFASWSPFPPQLANRHFRWPIQHQNRRWQTLARSEKISSDAASFRAGNCQFRFGDNVFPSALARPAGSWHSRRQDARESADVGSEHLRRGEVLDSLSQRNVHRYGKIQMSSKYLWILTALSSTDTSRTIAAHHDRRSRAKHLRENLFDPRSIENYEAENESDKEKLFPQLHGNSWISNADSGDQDENPPDHRVGARHTPGERVSWWRSAAPRRPKFEGRDQRLVQAGVSAAILIS